MTAEILTYRADQELPSLTFDWLDRAGAIIDYSTGWTFTVKLAPAATPTAVALTKTTGVAGAATLPNVSVDWTISDWANYVAATSALPASGVLIVVHLYARRTADSKDRVFAPGDEPIIRLLPAAA